MKRCPECRRDYYDDTLSFCLDDGAHLLEGPATDETKTKMLGATDLTDEPQTAILNNPAISEAQTKHEFHSAEKTEILPKDVLENPSKNHVASNKNSVIAAIIGIILITTLGIGSYWFYGTSTNRQIESIAVIPFVNESKNEDVEYLSDGMTETLINSLSNLPNLNVKARSSVFRYKGKETNPQTIGKELNVQAILTGRIVQRGEDLLLSWELFEAATEKHLAGGQYTRKMSDLISLQNEIARDVSQKLKAKLSGEDDQKLARNYTENAEAYQLYLKGRFHWNKRTPDDFRKAIEYFNQALTIEPNYALAYTGLADSYALLAIYTGGELPHEVMPKAKDAALKALSLDNNLAEAHAALGQILHNYDYDFDGAEREYKRAIELNPNYASAYQWYGELLSALGRQEEALGKLRKALEIDPLSLIINRVFGSALLYARQYDSSIAQLQKTVELDANFPGPHFDLYKVYWMKGNYAGSVEELARRSELLGRQQDALLMRQSFSKGGWQGFLREMTGTRRPSDSKSCNVAAFYTALGEKGNGIKELNECYEKRESDMIWLKVDPQLDPLRDDPRFKDLLKRMNLPE